MAVNDGVCDYDLCCDGSDEWAGVGGIKCENRCKEIGKEWRKNDEQRQRALGQAAKRRKELIADAMRLRKEVEARIQTLQIEAESSAVKVKELEVALAETEKRERGKVLKGAGKSSKIAVLVGLAKDRIEELRASLINVRQQRNDAIERVTELEALLTTFKEEYNPNFNDEGVKRAVRSWEEYAARDKPPLSHEADDRDLEEIAKPDEDSGTIRWSDWEEPDETDVEVCKFFSEDSSPRLVGSHFVVYKIEEYLPTPVRDWVDQKLRDLRTLLVENGILAPPHESGSESRKVTDARNALKAEQDSVENSQNQIRTHQEDLKKDYGPDDIFRALQGQCISKDSGEYTYEFCWLDRTKQKSRKGGSETGMGTFNRIDSVTVDEEVGPDGKGVGSGVRVALRYENGQHCWNGPNRSTLVVLACAEKDELWTITEEEKCVYRMDVGTPAVCGVSGNEPRKEKDEL